MKKYHVSSGSDVSAGKMQCNNCGKIITVSSVKSLPPCPQCKKADWKVLSGRGDAKEDPYPQK